MLLSSNSIIAQQPNDINIELKKHQLAMLNRCIEIENNNEYGIMSDRPGTGKTYVILSLINYFKGNNKKNIIVVPQNIYTQWINSIEKFSKNLSYIKFVNYDNILSLYNDSNILSSYDIILTTSSYYNIIATTLVSLNINVDRIFFDEIDSISNIICTKINADFIWFVSASFNINYLGYYGNKINNIETITCKCDDTFINDNIFLDEPIKKYYLCKNIYIDYILENIVTNKELKGLNAMDYRLDNKDFEKNKANNEKEIIDLILNNRRSIIEFDKFQIEESNKNINFYNEFINNKNIYETIFLDKINALDKLNNYKSTIFNFISDFDIFISIYMNALNMNTDNLRENEILTVKSVIEEMRKKDVKSLKIMLDDIIDLYYNIFDIKNICNKYFENKKSTDIDIILMNLKKMVVLFDNILSILNNVKYENEIIIKYHTILNENKNYIDNLISTVNNYSNTLISDNQMEIYIKQIEVSNKNIEENKLKIDLIYKRLIENNCCPVCYEIFDNIEENKIFISAKCCNNKVCGKCIDEWYNMKKESCIFCNMNDINKEDMLYYEKDPSISTTNNIENKLDNELINNKINNFEIYDYNKSVYLNNYIKSIKDIDKKIIIFSDYSHIFHYIELLCNENDIKYIDLDKGNIKDIDKSVLEYKEGNAKILLSNSTLFGCGMNFENSTDIIFVHQMNEDMEKQVIGRAQRMGRKSVLNIIYLEYENESKFIIKKNNYIENNNELNAELEKFYKNKQINSLLDNIQYIDYDLISSNEIIEDNSITILSSINNELNNDTESLSIYEIPNKIIDINLDELILNL
jgi:hypothetical protein